MRKIIITLLSCMLLLYDCTQSDIVTSEGNRVPDTEIWGDIEIRWGQMWDDLDAQFLDKKLYPFSESINGNIMSEGSKTDLVLLVNEEITKEQASEYATTTLKGPDDSVTIQDFSFNPSDEGSYGDFASNNDVNVLVALTSSFEGPFTHILESTIEANKEYRPIGMPTTE